MAANPPDTFRAMRDAAARDQRMAGERSAIARSLAASIARALVERFGATSVLLFGSLARSTFHRRSDIDLAVVGIDAPRLDLARAMAQGMSDIHVDLVRLEDLEEGFRQRLMESAEKLA